MNFDLQKYLDKELNLKDLNFDSIDNKVNRITIRVRRENVQPYLEKFMLEILSLIEIKIEPDTKK